MTIPPFLIPILAGVCAQALKPIISREWRDEQAQRDDLRPRYGGMPSAHTAFAVSLVTIVGLVDGVSSGSFAVSLGLLIFVLDDALRLRIFLGRFGSTLNKLTSRLPDRERHELPPIEERMGHTIPEVLAGTVVGLVVTFAIWFIEAL